MVNNSISVITVCYNSVDTIERTILSVIGQRYDNIEYIIIDGGSTDGTVDIIKKYSDSISYWVSERDKGIYDAMNKGIKRAHGEWVHFRNSGDFFLLKDTLRIMFEKPIAENVGVIHGNCIYYDCLYWYEQTPPCLRESYKREMPVLHPATFIRTKLQKQMPFDLQYKSSADYDFFYKCLNNGVVFEYRPVFIAAFEKGGFSSNWKRAYWENCQIQGLLNTFEGKFNAYKKYYKNLLVRHLGSMFPKMAMKKIDPSALNALPLPFETDF